MGGKGERETVIKNKVLRTFLVVQWLRGCTFNASNAAGTGSIPGWGTKILTCVLAWRKTTTKTHSFEQIVLIYLQL